MSDTELCPELFADVCKNLMRNVFPGFTYAYMNMILVFVGNVGAAFFRWFVVRHGATVNHCCNLNSHGKGKNQFLEKWLMASSKHMKLVGGLVAIFLFSHILGLCHHPN